LRGVGLEVQADEVTVALTRALAPEAIDQHLDVVDAELPEEAAEHIDHLGVRGGPRVAEHLAAGLIELPVPAALDVLRAEHRPEVIPAGDGLAGVNRVLDVGPRGARRALGA